MSSIRAGAQDTLNGGMKEGEREGASQPEHAAAVRLVPLSCNHRGKPHIATFPKLPVADRTSGVKEACSIL